MREPFDGVVCLHETSNAFDLEALNNIYTIIILRQDELGLAVRTIFWKKIMNTDLLKLFTQRYKHILFDWQEKKISTLTVHSSL